MDNMLNEKIDKAIELIRYGERLALEKSPEGYYLCFSGGKDSQVIYELAKMAGVKFQAYFSNTTIEIPENVQFINKYYKDVRHIIPEENFYAAIERKKFLPTMFARWCCAKYKEVGGKGRFCMVGVRAEESRKRSQYHQVAPRYAGMITQRERERERERDGMKRLASAYETGDYKKYKTWMIYPIFDWTEQDVWDFIDERGLPVNPCYEHFGRVGCLFCPYQSKRNMLFIREQYPKHYQLLLRSFERCMGNSKESIFSIAKTPEEVFEWWISKKSVRDWLEEKKQLKLL